MGHRKKHAPRRGSLGVRPRKRASSIIPRIRSWPRVEEGPVKPLGFLGYKVGMTHAIIIDDRPGSPTYGREIFAPLTVVETPPMIVAGVRLYESGSSGGKSLRALTEVWASLDILERAHVRRLIKNFHGTSEEIKSKVEGLIDRISDVRLLMLSQPSLITGVPKKKPDLVEVALAGIDVSEKLNYALSKIGSAVRVSEIFRAGQFVDVLGVTKGKGFQGVIKRFGVKELPRWHKHRKHSRTVGSRGSRVGALSSTPQAGQMGFHQRTEYNKRIIYVGLAEASDSLKEFTPPGGWHRYGLLRSDFVVILGSVQGPPKRPLILRHPVRPIPWEPAGAPRILYIDASHRMLT